VTLDGNAIVIRPAEPRDADALAGLHHACSAAQPDAFMHRLGLGFFLAYYRVLLREGTSVTLVADAGVDGIVGIVSATLDATRHNAAIHDARWTLLLATIPALLRCPRLAWEVLNRERSLSPGASGDGYGVRSGPRIVYWGWLPGYPSHGQSVALLKEALRRLGSLGANKVSLEADRLNRKVEVTHRMLGARVVSVLKLPDGRERSVLEYTLRPAPR
jgi:hypothetical protein